jgi:hypothetical protein
MIPYYLGQTVSFINSSEKPFVLIVTMDSIIWRYDEDDIGIIHRQERIVRLSSNLTNFYIELKVTVSNLYIILYSNFKSSYWLSYDEKGIYYKKDNYENDRQYPLDSIEINNKIYYDVVERINTYVENGLDERHTRSLLYNKSQGILQAKDKDKILFTIDN